MSTPSATLTAMPAWRVRPSLNWSEAQRHNAIRYWQAVGHFNTALYQRIIDAKLSKPLN
jgi:hypothetical protein